MYNVLAPKGMSFCAKTVTELTGVDPGFPKGGAKVYSEVGQEKRR